MKRITLTYYLPSIFLVLFFAFVGSSAAQQRGSEITDQYDNAAYLSQSTPGVMVPGQSYGVSVSMKNTGRSTWSQGNYSLKLINVNESTAKTWAVSSIEVNSTVSPGNEVVFNFTIIAPVEGSYNIQWQMANGNAFFGEPSINVSVRVSGIDVTTEVPSIIDNNAMFVSQNVQSEMETDLTYDVVVIMRNNGSTTWKTGEYKLKISTLGADNTYNAWSVANVEFSNDVTPGSEFRFVFKVTAPAKSGVYNFQCQLVRNGTFFGQPSTNVVVNVN